MKRVILGQENLEPGISEGVYPIARLLEEFQTQAPPPILHLPPLRPEQFSDKEVIEGARVLAYAGICDYGYWEAFYEVRDILTEVMDMSEWGALEYVVSRLPDGYRKAAAFSILLQDAARAIEKNGVTETVLAYLPGDVSYYAGLFMETQLIHWNPTRIRRSGIGVIQFTPGLIALVLIGAVIVVGGIVGAAAVVSFGSSKSAVARKADEIREESWAIRGLLGLLERDGISAIESNPNLTPDEKAQKIRDLSERIAAIKAHLDKIDSLAKQIKGTGWLEWLGIAALGGGALYGLYKLVAWIRSR